MSFHSCAPIVLIVVSPKEGGVARYAALYQFALILCLFRSAMKGTIELVAGTGLDENDIEEIQNAIEAALQGTRYEELFSVTSIREIESDTSMYYLRVSVPFGGITDDYADMQHRLQSSLLCHVEFASQ
jgi:hypothetical protein